MLTGLQQFAVLCLIVGHHHIRTSRRACSHIDNVGKKERWTLGVYIGRFSQLALLRLGQFLVHLVETLLILLLQSRTIPRLSQIAVISHLLRLYGGDDILLHHIPILVNILLNTGSDLCIMSRLLNILANFPALAITNLIRGFEVGRSDKCLVRAFARQIMGKRLASQRVFSRLLGGGLWCRLWYSGWLFRS